VSGGKTSDQEFNQAMIETRCYCGNLDQAGMGH